MWNFTRAATTTATSTHIPEESPIWRFSKHVRRICQKDQVLAKHLVHSGYIQWRLIKVQTSKTVIISDDWFSSAPGSIGRPWFSPQTSRNNSYTTNLQRPNLRLWVGKSTTFQEKVICEKCQNISIYLTSWRRCIQVMYIQLSFYQRVIRMNQSNIMSVSAIRKKNWSNQPTNLQQKNLSKEHRFQGCHGSMDTSLLINLSQVGGDKSTLKHGQRVTVSSPLKMDGWKMKCPFEPRPIFRGYVKFPGCIKSGR